MQGGLNMYVGVDVQDTKIAIGLVSDKGAVSFQSSLPINPEKNSDAVMLDIIYIIKTISETVPLELFNDRLLGIGLGIQDNLDKESGNLVQCTNPGSRNISQKEIIERHFEIPVYVENHKAAETLAANEVKAHKGNDAGIIAAGMLCKYLK
jgi:glucokinase